MKKIVLISVMASAVLMAGTTNTVVEPIVEIPTMEAVMAPSQSGFYVGLGYVTSSIDEDHMIKNESNTWDANSVAFIAGYNYNQYVAVEGRYTTNVGDLSYDGVRGSYDYDGENSNFGVYVKPQFPIGDINVYALLGYGSYSVDYTEEIGYDGSQGSFQWAIGTAYRITPNIDLFVDYTSFYNDSSFDNENDLFDYDISGYTFGVNYRF